MKLTYLGTAAAEGFPALFCRCEYCMEARKLGGKNIRTRSQSLVNDDLLIDLPADTYHHFLVNNIEADKIKYLLITHAHSDHIYPLELENHHGAYAHNMREETLKVYCSKEVSDIIGTPFPNIEITVLSPYETVDIGGYKITPLPARHKSVKEPFIYIIEGDKTLLYAHDTGYFLDEVLDYLENEKPVFDMVSFDCTNVDIKASDEGSHMGFSNIERLSAKLKNIGVITENTKLFVNHFSHNGNPLHEHLVSRANEYGMEVSYDGCVVEI